MNRMDVDLTQVVVILNEIQEELSILEATALRLRSSALAISEYLAAKDCGKHH